MSSRKKCTGESCCLCSGQLHGRKHAHAEKLPADLRKFLFDFDSSSSSSSQTGCGQCICKACEVSARDCLKKRDNGEMYRPRWQEVQRDLCCIPSCSAVSNIHKHPFTWREICSCIGIASIDCDPTLQKSLCANHYQLVYRFVRASKVRPVFCRVCEVKRKHEHTTLAEKFIPCPNPPFVELYLRDTIGFEANITEDDVLCFRCYKYVSRILNSDICMLSNANILAELEAKEVQFGEVVEEFSPSDGESHVQLALFRTALHVCKIVKLDQAFLFPDIYKVFHQFLPCDIDAAVSTTKSRLLTFLGNEFGQLLTSFCCNKRIGTVFHRTKADLSVLLSNSLGKHSGEIHAHQSDTSSKLSESVQTVIRHMIHRTPDLSQSLVLNVDSFIESICSQAPDLWEHIKILTQSVNERKGRKAATSNNTSASRLKRLRRAYLLSVVLFTTNSECCFPFHVPLADAVEASGGSTELITALNRIGAVASVDTLKRVILSVSQERKDRGIQSLLVPQTFTVASVDNVDFLQSHAAVYSGSQHRSCHFTSLQLVQPQPHQTSQVRYDDSAGRRLFDITNQPASYGAAKTPPNPASRKLRVLLGHKRSERGSPLSSPQSIIESPQSKKQRARTFAESSQLTGRTESEVLTTLARPASSTALPLTSNPDISFNSFLANSSEKLIAEKVNKLLFDYIFLQEACCSSNNRLVDMKTFCGLSFESLQQSQPSNVVYLSIVDMHADSREAMEAVASKLHKEYEVGVRAQHLVVVGDQKTYSRLQELKHVYGEDLNWLVPFIGDWHLLHNFHSVLMTVYYDAGLKDLALSSGYRGETLKSLKHCTNFKRTHAFLLQSMNAFYRHFLQEFFCSCESTELELCKDLLSSSCAHMYECNKDCQEQDSGAPLKTFLENFHSQNPDFFVRFGMWLVRSAEADPNWKFWVNYVFRDVFSYFSLFFSIRSGMWDLRLYGIKQIAPLFAAFDRPHYQKLIPCHLHEVLLMPEEIIEHFERGAFVCSITGSSVRSVALDEAHEMLVNKDLKTTVVRPTKEYIDRIIHYYPVRAEALKALKQELLSDGAVESSSRVCVLDKSPHAAKVEENVVAMITKVKSTKLLAAGSKNPLQSLSGQLAKPEQEKDLLSFWEVGLKQFENRMKYFILRDPSAKVPQRQVKLLTYATSKPARRKIKMIEREKKIVNKCVRRSLAWNTKVDSDQQYHGGQYLELPRSISDPHGRAHKGTKSYAIKWLEKRYKDIVTNQLPSGWTAEVVVLEGMFLINTSPLSTHRSMKEYSLFLLRRFVLPHFIGGSVEVHLVFDQPGKLANFPKILEQQRRDDTSSLSPDHQHSTFTDECTPPSHWRELLSCRECKRKLVVYLGEFLMHNTGMMLRGQQQFILAGCFLGDAEDHAWAITSQTREPIPALNSDAEEADTRIWLHVLRSGGTQKLVCSPDTDVFHIGLPLLNPVLGTSLDPAPATVNVIVQLNPYTSIEHRYLLLDRLRTALSGDPDLSVTPHENRPKLLQSLFICTGSDFTSFFVGLGKATFMRLAFQHCAFINADSASFPGSLSYTAEERERGFLAFLRLIGTAYFSKHRSCFPFESPQTFLNSFQSCDSKTQHSEWLESIRSTIWERTEFEDELPPSVEALWRHWLRSCWVSHYWSEAARNHCNVLDVTSFGWKIGSNGCLEIDWDDPLNVSKVRERVKLLLRGCSCRKGCNTRRCSCLKAEKKCGPGCRCCNCMNTVHHAQAHTALETADIETSELEEDECRRQDYFNEVVGDELDGEDSENSSADEDLECPADDCSEDMNDL